MKFDLMFADLELLTRLYNLDAQMTIKLHERHVTVCASQLTILDLSLQNFLQRNGILVLMKHILSNFPPFEFSQIEISLFFFFF